MSFFNRDLLKLLALGASAASLLSCSGGSSSITAIGSVGGSGGTSIAVTNVFPSSQSNSFSTPAASGRYYVKGLDASIYGTCSRGVATIKVNEGAGDYAETATCLSDGTFSWTKTYTAGAGEGDKTLNLTAYDIADSAISGATASVDVRIDATAPAVPGLVSPASSPHAVTGAATTYTIQLSHAADVVSVTGPASVELTLSGANYEYTVPLVSGASNTYTFYAHDLAGNLSAGVDVTISYSPSVGLKIGDGSFLGGPVTDTSGALYRMESTVTPVSSRSTDSGTSYTLETGFNFIMNQVRAN